MVDAEAVIKICNIYDRDGKGKLDLFYLGDVLYALGINTTKKICDELGQTDEEGKKMFAKFLPRKAYWNLTQPSLLNVLVMFLHSDQLLKTILNKAPVINLIQEKQEPVLLKMSLVRFLLLIA